MNNEVIDLKNKVSRCAIMGGTFDPIHFGHLVTAEAVRVKYNLDKVIFVPTGNPPHKNKEEVTMSMHRYIMVEMATVTNPYFQVSRIELDREGYTYTVDTVKQLMTLFGTKTELFFITGADAILEILTWKNVDELLPLCKFIAVTRPGYTRKDLDNKIVELKKTYNCDIFIMDVPAFEISSTDIRNKAAHNQSIKYFVPENVENYIYKNSLYNLHER